MNSDANQEAPVNVYDFDKTVYDGDSTVHFFLFCLRRHPRVLKAFPGQLAGFAGYGLKRIDKTAMKQRFYAFLQHLDDVDATVDAFWREHGRNMKDWYLAQRRDDDVVVSAGPEFLLAPFCARLGVRLMASRVDARTGAYTGVNCHGAEKVRRFREVYPSANVEAFYSDSLSDAPLAGLAERAYLVKGDALEPWPAGGPKA